MSKIRDKAHMFAGKNLKKIIASKGALQGNFYFAGNSKATEAAIYISLSTKDKDGGKAASEGKKLRGEISGAKFARGVIRAKGAKVFFEIHAGSADAGLLKKAFRGVLSEEAGLKLIKKAVPRSAGSEDEGDDGDTISGDELLADMSDEERAQLIVLIDQQGDLSRLNETLASTFLSKEADEAERIEQLEENLKKIDELESALAENPSTDARNALQAQRLALAESIYVGSEEFPSPPAPLPQAMREVMQASIDNNVPRLEKLVEASAKRIISADDAVESAPPQERAALRRGLLAEVESEKSALEMHVVQLKSLIKQLFSSREQSRG